MDGTACAILYLVAGGQKKNIIFSNPNHADVEEKLLDVINSEDKHIFMADLSVSEEMAIELYKGTSYDRIEIIDHHSSVVPLKRFSFCHIDEGSCGSKLFYNRLMLMDGFHGQLSKYHRLIELVDDIDRWQNNYPESRQLASLHKIIGQELFLERFMKNPDVDLSTQELYLIEMYDKKLQMDIKNAKRHVKCITKTVGNREYRFGIVIGYGMDQSLLGRALVDDPEMQLDVAVIVGATSLSFRCRNDCALDLSKFAELNGGGGHKAAAGCNLNALFGVDFLDLIVDNLKFK
jgi:oligoribonuclease NrnB/cAMP/cGMP phosphodiesterase (DHH superfamily)